MSATRDLIAAALTAADKLDEFKYSDLQRAATTLREMCARAMVDPDGWQPIETAPKDGTSVFLCRAIDADGNPIDWSGNLKTAQVFVQVASWWSDDDGWVVYCSLISEPRLHFEPTHWMPLPGAPK